MQCFSVYSVVTVRSSSCHGHVRFIERKTQMLQYVPQRYEERVYLVKRTAIWSFRTLFRIRLGVRVAKRGAALDHTGPARTAFSDATFAAGACDRLASRPDAW